MQRRSEKPKKGEAAPPAALDEGASKKWPRLVEMLTCTSFDGGEARHTSTVLLFCEGGRWKGCLNDREEGQVLFTAAGTLLGVLEALEKALAGDQADWREAGSRRK